MSTIQAQTPAGWYPEPIRGVGHRYWDGNSWTDYVSVSGQQYISPINPPAAMEVVEEKPKRKLYWGNLFRIRVWWFSLVGPLVICIALSLIGVPSSATAVLYVPMALGIAWFWLTQQMACSHCGTILRVTRLTGGQEVCQKCGLETDKSLRS